MTDGSPIDAPGRELSEQEWNDRESLESAITRACEEAGYHFGIGEGCTVAAEAALRWFADKQSALERRTDCKIYIEPCSEHNFIHGAEAEELRERIEKLLEFDGDIPHHLLWRVLDEVDARDSLAYLEAKKRD